VKKNIFFWLAILAAALLFVFLGWAFSQHGTIGLFRVNGTFQKLFIILGVFGLVLAGSDFAGKASAIQTSETQH
jgi:multisubunit Na+/H+ antiporter MnhG subunit